MEYGQSNYNGLQAKLDKRFSNGLNFLATYTWNHTLDDSYDPIAGGVSDRNVNMIPIRDEWTNSPYDVRQRVNFDGYYNLPFGKGQRFMNHGGILIAALGNWSTDLAFFAQTGKPFGVSPTGVTTAGGGTSRATPGWGSMGGRRYAGSIQSDCRQRLPGDYTQQDKLV